MDSITTGGRRTRAALVIFGIAGVLAFSSVATGQSTAPKLDPTTIPKFVNQLDRLPVFVPQLVRDSQGNIIRKEFNVEIAKFMAQELPPPFPQTQLFGYGGQTVDAFGNNRASAAPHRGRPSSRRGEFDRWSATGTGSTTGTRWLSIPPSTGPTPTTSPSRALPSPRSRRAIPRRRRPSRT